MPRNRGRYCRGLNNCNRTRRSNNWQRSRGSHWCWHHGCTVGCCPHHVLDVARFWYRRRWCSRWSCFEPTLLPSKRWSQCDHSLISQSQGQVRLDTVLEPSRSNTMQNPLMCPRQLLVQLKVAANPSARLTHVAFTTLWTHSSCQLFSVVASIICLLLVNCFQLLHLSFVCYLSIVFSCCIYNLFVTCQLFSVVASIICLLLVNCFQLLHL